MKIIQYILLFLLGIALTVTMLFFELPFWLIYVSIVIVYILLLVVPQMYTVYKSNNLKRIERYLEQNKRKPIFAYPLAVKSGNPEQINQAIQAILDKHKQTYMQEVYKTNMALYENNVSKIDHLSKQISKDPLRTYYMAYAEVLKGNFEEAYALKKNLPTGWMPHAIEAIISKERGDMNTFRKEAEISIDQASGVQKFNLLYSFKWMEKHMC